MYIDINKYEYGRYIIISNQTCQKLELRLSRTQFNEPGASTHCWEWAHGQVFPLWEEPPHLR